MLSPVFSCPTACICISLWFASPGWLHLLPMPTSPEQQCRTIAVYWFHNNIFASPCHRAFGTGVLRRVKLPPRIRPARRQYREIVILWFHNIMFPHFSPVAFSAACSCPSVCVCVHLWFFSGGRIARPTSWRPVIPHSIPVRCNLQSRHSAISRR